METIEKIDVVLEGRSLGVIETSPILVKLLLEKDVNLGVLATSGSLEILKKSIEKFYYSEITLVQKDDEWEVHNSKGHIKRTFVRKVGKRYRFEDIKNR